MAAKIERTPLHRLTVGQLGDFYALLSERTRKTTRDGKPFYHVKFRDKQRVASVMVWNNSPLFEPCDQHWQRGQFFKLRAVYKVDQYGGQLEVHAIRPIADEDKIDGFDPGEFVACTRFDVEELWTELLSIADQIADRPLQRLVTMLLQRHALQFKRQPAASQNHHAYRGGLLEHTLSVTRTGVYLADKYRDYYPDLKPPVNKDLIIAGCLLHDIGKLVELSDAETELEYTVPGRLIGHILIGRDMVRDAAVEISDLNPQLLLLLEHIITAHQALPEWGSPKEPMIPEALLVHFADDIDAKMNMYVEILRNSESAGPFTDGNNIFRRRLFKDRQV